MKKISFIITLMLSVWAAKAQAPVESSVVFNKTSVPGVSLLLNGYSTEVIQEAIQYRFEKTAIPPLKGSKAKGCYRAYVNQQFPEFSTMNLTIYVMVEQYGKKKGDQALLSIVVSKGNSNYASTTSDPDIINKVKAFLQSFNRYIFEYDTNLKINEQNALYNSLQKDVEKAGSDIDKMRKEILDIESKILKKEKEIDEKNIEAGNAKAKIDELNSKL
jgi:hypothetical protein